MSDPMATFDVLLVETCDGGMLRVRDLAVGDRIALSEALSDMTVRALPGRGNGETVHRVVLDDAVTVALPCDLVVAVREAVRVAVHPCGICQTAVTYAYDAANFRPATLVVCMACGGNVAAEIEASRLDGDRRGRDRKSRIDESEINC